MVGQYVESGWKALLNATPKLMGIVHGRIAGCLILRQDNRGGIGATVAIPGVLSSTNKLELAMQKGYKRKAYPVPEA